METNGPLNEYVYTPSTDASLSRLNYHKGVSNSAWCNSSGWPEDPNLGPSGDRSNLDWSKSLQDQLPDINSLFPQRPWRTRTSSDNGAITNKTSQV